MYQREQIIEQLGIQSWPADKQDEVVEEATFRIGSAITDRLTEQQFNEYQAIVNNDENVINGWLETNVPDYKESPVYQEIEASEADDPERNNPAKLFASVAWIQLNVPQVQEVIAEALEAYKQELNAASTTAA